MPDQDSSKSDWLGILKKSGIFIIILAVFLLVIFFGLSKYGEWSLERNIKKTIENENRPYLEDTYGGKTPKETLELFIAVVEKEDFDLASKYFVLSKQEEWRERMTEGKKNDDLNKFLKLIDDEIGILSSADPLWISEDHYISTNSVLFEYVKYPQGIWKIKEI